MTRPGLHGLLGMAAVLSLGAAPSRPRPSAAPVALPPEVEPAEAEPTFDLRRRSKRTRESHRTSRPLRPKTGNSARDLRAIERATAKRRRRADLNRVAVGFRGETNTP
jgi:hypothetical protein